MTCAIGREVETCTHVFTEQKGCEVVELKVQVDHVHLLAMIPPKVSVSGFVGTVGGRTAIRVLSKFRKLKEKPYWGNHFWSRGYCVDTVGLDTEMIAKYIRYQEQKERASENRDTSGVVTGICHE